MARTFGRYRLIEPIAAGGMAEVWRAEAPGAQGFVKQVALKLVRGGQAASDESVRMFIREARLASRLAHANIVQVFDFDRVDGQYYIAMELVRGRSLREVVDRCRARGVRLGVGRAVHVCAEVARALAYAHRVEDGGQPLGLVHRDVSPQNVLVSFEGEVKLADFGIARALGSDETTPGTLKGKLSYMAPEQARGERVDGRADVFSLGAMLWELCTGRRLFARDSEAATLAALLSDEPISAPSSWNEDVPPPLDALVMGALVRDPAGRTASAAALVAGLAAAAHALAGAGADLDLRGLMRRLWPDGQASHEPGADAPGGGQAAADLVSAPAGGDASLAPAGGASVDAGGREASPLPLPPTVTLPATRRRGRGWVALGAAATALVLAAGGVTWRGLGPLAGWHPMRRRAAVQQSPAAAPGPPASRAGVLTAEPPVPPPGATAPATPVSTPGTASIPPPVQAPAEAQVAISTTAKVATPPASATAPGAGDPVAASLGPPVEAPAQAQAERASSAERPPALAARPRKPQPALVTVQVRPWALLSVDGAPAGEVPAERRVKPGRRLLRAVHPTLGSDAVEVDLLPGARFVWRVHLH